MNLTEYPSPESLMRTKNDKTLRWVEIPDYLSVGSENYKAFNAKGAMLIWDVTHEVHHHKIGLIAILSITGLGTNNGYISGANIRGEGNHDLSPGEVRNLIQRATVVAQRLTPYEKDFEE